MGHRRLKGGDLKLSIEKKLQLKIIENTHIPTELL
jgi:hypothetical protein